MRYVSFAVYATLIVIIALVTLMLGCDSQIVCTDSFCIVPRDTVDGEVIEVDENKVLGLIASDMLTTPENEPTELIPEPITPQTEPTAPDTINIADIIADAAAGGTAYVGQTVTIQATVAWKSPSREAILIYTSSDFRAAVEEGAGFFIYSIGNAAALNPYSVGATYSFTVTITEIRPPDETLAIYKIGGRLVD